MVSLQLHAPDQADYLAHVAATEAGTSYKQRMLDLLDVRPGHRLLDGGCGPGTDLPRLADSVGAQGRVVGADRDARMAGLARERTPDGARVAVAVADLHDLPFADEAFDRARTDRVLQHVHDPARALAELRRVLSPDGRVVIGEPDWDSLVVDHPDADLARRYTRHVTEQVVRNSGLGHQLPRLLSAAGFEVGHVEPVPTVFADLERADAVLGLARNTTRAVEAGYFDSDQAAAFMEGITSGPFLAAVNLWIVVGA